MFKIVEKYWEAGLRSVYLICCGIDHNYFRNFGLKPIKYTLYAWTRNLKEYKCRVSD